MLKLAIAMIACITVLYGGACAYLYVNQRAFLYFPTPQVAVADAENIVLNSDGETLRIWRIGPPGKDAVIYFGGNAQDVSSTIPMFLKALPNQSVYLVNYRGYGGSTGLPNEAALYKDAAAIFDHVRQKHAHVSVIGQSLGSGVAVFLATIRTIARLVLITPYDSMENVAKAHFPQFPVSLLLKDKFMSSQRAGAIETPTLVLLAESDEVIPRANSEALIAAFRSSQPTVSIIRDTTHNSICTSDSCLKHLSAFLWR